ncbi:MAG: methyltransferase family protein [Promethearchaeota archaeon]
MIYFTVIIPDFWIENLIGLPELKLTNIISICCSTTIALFSYFQIRSDQNMKISIEEIKNKLKLFYLRLGTLLAYFPIIAGILYPMTVMPALAYFSWNIFYLSPASQIFSFWILNVSYFPDFPTYPLIWAEFIMFVCGFALFLYGLIHLTKAKKENIEIAQTGPYKYIRHPQNLGIIIFSLPFSLYVPFIGTDMGIKVGDLFSWMLFFLLTIIYSDIEEIHMLKKYPEQYGNYKAGTGFFIPTIIKTRRKESNLDIKNYFYRWILLVGIYFFLVAILTFIFSQFPLLNLKDLA